MTFKAIVFDYGNVLAGTPGPSWAQDIPKIIGVPANIYSRAVAKYSYAVNHGDLTWPELWANVLTDLDLMDKLPEVIANTVAYENSLEHINQDVANLARHLHESGFKTGVLSNTTTNGAARIHRTLSPYPFDAIHCSAETGLVKPDPGAFNAIASELGVSEEAMIFIDDSERSLSTAEQCGYTPILFTGYDELVSTLEGLGIPID
jgi:HAD superfamily hydrolase (TIGR01509 family)